MLNEAELIEELGIKDFTEEEQQHVLEELNMRIGEALMEGKTDAQIAQYTAIINGDQAVIDEWLMANTPDYTSTKEFKDLAANFANDPENDVPASKVYASMAWMQVNNPDLAEVVNRTKNEFKPLVEQYKR